jgi:nitrate reductase gamma subunit
MWKTIIKEVLLFDSLFRTNRSLWGGTWVFHVSLLLILAGHARIVTDFPQIWNLLGIRISDVHSLEYLLGGGAGIMVLAMGIYLMARRLVVQRVSEISTREDYLVLCLLLAIILSGDALRFFTGFDATQSRAFFRALILFQSLPVPSHPLFLIHFFLAQLLLIVVPFTKFMHIPGIFLTKSMLLKT